ncbi:hypothetical protein M378DRAFT_17195 [Amanita muscaria Koide BX008]|uniref:Uncharacterized protein n=1 Tax=Amanita muscaria (strain Koide BX008) TaxID=946122 RepID=A0A0C2S0Z4_AMAMK|nr:hypothetical protein M378DRAFT_17195 [Amanita muscaria Koide BX008]
MLQSEFVLVYDRLGLLPTLRVKVHRVLGILLDPRAASRILYEVIDRESAVLMDLLETFDNITYTPPMGDEVSRYRINLMVDLALRLLQNGIELILYESLRRIDWEQVLLRTAEELSKCLASQTKVLQHCSKLQTKLEQETRALSAIVPLAFKELPKLEWSEECYLDDIVQRLGHLASPLSLLPDAPIVKTPELTYPTFPAPFIPPVTPEIQRKRDQRRRRRNQTARKPTPPSPSPGPIRQVARRTQGRPPHHQGRRCAPTHSYRRPDPLEGFYDADNYVDGYDDLVDYD